MEPELSIPCPYPFSPFCTGEATGHSFVHRLSKRCDHSSFPWPEGAEGSPLPMCHKAANGVEEQTWRRSPRSLLYWTHA